MANFEYVACFVTIGFLASSNIDNSFLTYTKTAVF